MRGFAATLVAAVALAVPAVDAGARLLQAPPEPLAGCPLTGLQAPSTRVERPAVAVRVSNSSEALPQRGLPSADVVIETPVEGGLTRLIAIFHCSAETTVGPVRSARLDDATIVLPYAGLLGYSGSNAAVQLVLGKTGLELVAETHGSGALYRDPWGSTDVSSLRANLDTLREVAEAAGLGEPAARLSFGDLQSPSEKATLLGLDFGNTFVGYRWAEGLYRRSQAGKPFLDASGEQVTARNVLVQEVDVYASELRDSIGIASPTFDLAGPGRALLFRDGRVVAGTWVGRPGEFVFRTTNGDVMSLAAGRTWIEMVPSRIGQMKGMIFYR